VLVRNNVTDHLLSSLPNYDISFVSGEKRVIYLFISKLYLNRKVTLALEVWLISPKPFLFGLPIPFGSHFPQINPSRKIPSSVETRMAIRDRTQIWNRSISVLYFEWTSKLQSPAIPKFEYFIYFLNFVIKPNVTGDSIFGRGPISSNQFKPYRTTMIPSQACLFIQSVCRFRWYYWFGW